MTFRVCNDCARHLIKGLHVTLSPNAPDQARLQPSPEAGCSAFPFALRAADRMSAIIDEMVRDGQLDARSRLADARLDYGKPWAYAHTPNEQVRRDSAAPERKP
jgi:hypothetical protein